MALFHMNRAYNFTPNMLSISGSFVVPANRTTVNAQVIPALLTLGTAGTSQLTPTETVAPLGSLVNVFCTPNGSAAGATGNISNIPSGLAAGASSTVGSEFVVDCSGFAADILSATVNYQINARGIAGFLNAFVSAVDNVNKLVYIQVVNASGAATVAAVGATIGFQVDMKDAFAP